MIGCCDLRERAELFAIDVKLQSISSVLKDILEGKVLDSQKKELLNWAGDLIGELDWDSSAYKSRQSKKDVYFLLTTNKLRPMFYQAFLDMQFLPNRDFLDRFYETLHSSEDRIKLSHEELGIAQKLVEKMADKLFSCYQNIGNI